MPRAREYWKAFDVSELPCPKCGQDRVDVTFIDRHNVGIKCRSCDNDGYCAADADDDALAEACAAFGWDEGALDGLADA